MRSLAAGTMSVNKWPLTGISNQPGEGWRRGREERTPGRRGASIKHLREFTSTFCSLLQSVAFSFSLLCCFPLAVCVICVATSDQIASLPASSLFMVQDCQSATERVGIAWFMVECSSPFQLFFFFSLLAEKASCKHVQRLTAVVFHTLCDYKEVQKCIWGEIHQERVEMCGW